MLVNERRNKDILWISIVNLAVVLIDIGYPKDALVSCFKEKLANISSEKQFGSEKCPVYLKCPRLEMFHRNLKTKLIKALHLASVL